jgi:tetratricopeptide (TPR) repeat protein
MSRFNSKGGDQNIGIGTNAIGQHNNITQQVDGNGNIVSGTGDVRIEHLEQHLYAAAPPVIPRFAPDLDDHFLGRDKELAELLPLLLPGKVVTLCGPGGMGKSALAAQAVSKLEPSRFPDGIVFHTFYGHPQTELALRSIAKEFAIKPEPSLDIAVRNALSGKKALLILDGAEDAKDLPAVLRLRGSCGVLITTRSRKDALAVRLNIKPLDDKPAAELLAAWSGQDIDAETTRRICTHLGGLPVAVRIVGHYLRSTDEPAAEYLRWLDKEPLGQLSKGKHRTESVAVLLRRSVDQVSADARQVLALAGTLAYVPISGSPVAVILDDDDERCRDALNELVNYGLLERQKERWQISHALVHTYARTELVMSKEKLERLASYYISFCEAASAENAKGYARLNDERAHCLRLMESCLASALWQEVKGLVAAIRDYLDRQGYWTEQLTAVGMRLTAAQQAGDRKDEGECLHNLGYTCNSRGEPKKALAYYEQALPIRRELGDRKGEGVTLNNMAAIYQQQGKHELALQYYKQDLTICREGGDRKGEGTTLNNIGAVYSMQGDKKQALAYYEQALPIHREVGNKSVEGATLNNIALIYYAQGKPAKALEYHEQALAICQQLGDRAGEAKTSGNIGATYIKQGDLAKAEEYISQAVQIAEDIGSPYLEAWRKELKLVQAKRRAAQESGGEMQPSAGDTIVPPQETL